jgi:hypothetical protein
MHDIFYIFYHIDFIKLFCYAAGFVYLFICYAVEFMIFQQENCDNKLTQN